MIYHQLKNVLKKERNFNLKRGEILYHEGDFPQGIYLVDKGLIGLFHISESGKETFLRIFGQFSFLGQRSFFAQMPYHGTSVALAETQVTYVSMKSCDSIFLAHNNILCEFVKVLARDLGEAELRLSGLLDKTANVRICETLLYLKFKYPEHTWTRREIAEYSGSTLETVTRVMTLLAENNLIEKRGRDFEVLNYEEILSFFK